MKLWRKKMAFDMEEQFSEECVDSGIHEECGVFGAYDFDGNDIASTVYYGLFALQHRGQESCGIAVSDTNGPKKNIQVHKGMGLVNEVFNSENLEKLKGNISVGHVRYSTAGSSTRENAQPLVLNYYKGTLALAHNGNLVNALELRKELERTGAIFQTTIDSEVIAYHVAKERIFAATAEEAVLAAMRKLKGAYSLIVMSPRKLIGARDPFGFRPLCIGKRDNTYFLTSETCALDTVGAEFVRDVEPGEVVTLTPKGIESNKELCFKDPSKQARCIFEYIYFARPDAVIDGVGVYASRIKAGKFLAMDSPVDADMVVGVPESGNPAAQGYAMESGIPYGTAFIKNSYVGRTFIKPKQSMRESSVQVKLNVLKDAVKGKRIVMIDDSIVRGTTCRRIVRMLKDRCNRGYPFHHCLLWLHPLVIHPLTLTDMAKRNSKTAAQQCRYYEVDNIFVYMVETYINGNFETFRRLYHELNKDARRDFMDFLLSEVEPTYWREILKQII